MKASQLSLLLVLGSAAAGCFKINETAGLRAAFEDADLASSKASELKALTTAPQDKLTDAVHSYQDAKAKINAYLKAAEQNAADFSVDEPLSNYTDAGAGPLVQAFKHKVDLLAGPQTFSVTAIVTAATVLAEIQKLNHQEQQAAYQRFVDTIEKNMLKNYEELSPAAPTSPTQ